MRIVVCGGGIGGLTAAGLLDRAGHDVVLVEKASAFGEIGAGIQLSPNGVRVLAELGLTEGLAQIGTTPERVVSRRWEDDRVLLTRPLGSAPRARYGFPYYNVYRPDLIELLTSGLGDTTVTFGAEVVTAATDADVGARVELADGSVLEGDVVVGADGIHSAVRTAVFGPQPSRFSGYVAYRALVPGDRVRQLPIEVGNRMGDDRHLVTYFVGRGQRHYNVVAVVPEPTWDVESWTEPGELRDLRRYFAGWAPAVGELLDHVVEPVYRWALHDREPLERWSEGRVTLLGDACHPMLPFMAQGACQAIEDGAYLRTCLADTPEGTDAREAGRGSPDGERAHGEGADPVTTALRRYEGVRRPRSARLQAMSWANATTFHLPDGPDQERRDAVMADRSSTTDAALESLDWLYAYDPFTASELPVAT